MKPYEIIKQISETNSRIEKEKIISQVATEGHYEFFEGLKLCYDSMITFGVKEIPSSKTDGPGLEWDNFLELTVSLRKRELTGNAAREAIDLAIRTATQDEWNGWYKPILQKDMRAGFSETTVNKVVKKLNKTEYQIPVFTCQLAEDANNHPNKLEGQVICDRKYDGTRALVFLDYNNHTVSIFSRNGKEFQNFDHIAKGLEPLIDVFGRDFVLDGEIISSSFQALMRQVQRKTNVQADDAVLMIFDGLPAFEFRTGKSTQRQRTRFNYLKSFEQVIKETGVAELVEQVSFDLDSLVGKIEMEDWMKKVVAEGLEGIMIKNPNAYYECKRGTNWLKRKPVITVDLTIVGYEEGTGRNKNRLGAIICEGTDQGKFIRVNCGSGFTDTERKDYWENKESLIGQVVEVAADTLTLNQDSTDVWSLRFPRLSKFRGFTKGEKI